METLINSTSITTSTMALQSLFEEEENKLQTARKYLQTTRLTEAWTTQRTLRIQVRIPNKPVRKQARIQVRIPNEPVRKRARQAHTLL